MDEVSQTLDAYNWPYASQDAASLLELHHRIADIGRRSSLITYSDVVRGITFRIRTVASGQPFSLGSPEWTELHRAILGDFLGRLCLDTYQWGRFLGSALVVGASQQEPSEGFRSLVRELGLVRSSGKGAFLEFWAAEVAKAHAWYSTHEL